MGNPANLQAVLSFLRSMLIVAGTWFTARGYVSESNATEIIGAIAVMLPVAWGAWQKFFSEAKTKAREVVAITAGIVIADSTVGKTPTIAPVDVPAAIKAIAPQIVVVAPTTPPIVLEPS
jgi:hypothetical protein